MTLIMPNRRVDMDVDVTSATNSCDIPQYDVFNFDESPRQRMHDSSIQNILQLSSYYEKNECNLENLKLNKLPQILFEEIQSSMNDWEEYMFCKEHEALTKSVPNIENLPDVRGFNIVIKYPERNNLSNSSFRCSKIEIRSHEDLWSDDTSEEQMARKKLRADAEKCRGNVAYKEGNYIKACEHYSNSISIIPTKEAYNNRAQANIRLENYSSALPDLDEVLKQDPLNLKALNRRALCRFNIRMYHEALRDLQSIMDLNPKCKEASSLMADIRKAMAGLKGRKYRMRLIADRYRTFEVDISQLPVYAEYEGNYILEVDKSGCVKSCVCSHCIDEDYCSRYRSNTLRIKERPRWKRLTTELLKELHVNVSASTTNSAAIPSANNSVTTNRIEGAKNEYSRLDSKPHAVKTAASGQDTSIDQFYEKQLRDKNLVNAAYNSLKVTSANVISTTTTNALALPAMNTSFSQTKFMKDSQNLSHQRAVSIENAVQNLQLEDSYLQNGDVANILKNCSPAALKKKFDSRLDEATLEALIHFVCTTFEPENDWPLMLQYLKAITELERFKTIISFIGSDSKTKKELMSVLTEAINMKLEDASRLKSQFFEP